MDGRLIATAIHHQYSEIKIIDKYDDLSPLLCDDYFTIEWSILFDENTSFDIEGHKVKMVLSENNINWIDGIWLPIESLTSPPRKIYP